MTARHAVLPGLVGLAVLALFAVPARRSRGFLDRCRLDAAPVDRVTLPHDLDEISGLAATESGRLLAHDDERGLVYEIDPVAGDIVKTFQLGAGDIRADFEGIAMEGTTVWLITSGGYLYQTSNGPAGASVPYRAVDTGLGARCEIEGLAYEPSGRVLLMACKTPLVRSLEDQVTVWRWSVEAGRLAADSMIAVPLRALSRLREFHPSGIDRDPVSGHYLLVAANEREIVEITPAGAVVTSASLRRRDHPQAEGIAVLPSGGLLISDERHRGSGGGGRATVSRYVCPP